MLLVLTVLANWVFPGRGGWVVSLVGMVVFVMLVGDMVAKRPLGALIDKNNLMSLSRFQTTLWTVIVLSAYLSLVIVRIRCQVDDALNVIIDPKLWALLGISLTSLVGAPLLNSSKQGKTADQGEAVKTGEALAATSNLPAGVSADNATAKINERKVGVLYANPKITDASFSDLFEGDEVGTAAYVDLAKLQMFFFTVVLAASYLALLWNVFASIENQKNPTDFGASVRNITLLPVPPEGMIALLGISHAGFLASGGITRTKQAAPAQQGG